MANKIIKHSKGKKETMDDYVDRRNKETGKVVIPETKKKKFEAGKHELLALQSHEGLVKPGTAKRLERMMHKRKRRHMEGRGF